jgi:NAD(P)H-dependent flavin oxidoreductase YrpB (nitropropane dioxygenase family)
LSSPLASALPVMQAPIGPATTPELVAAVSTSGALGTLAASWTPPDLLRRQLEHIRAATTAPFCVNLVLAFDQRARLDLALALGAPAISFSWGLDPELIARTRTAGASVLVQVSSGDEGRAAEAAGANIILAQGMEAGGHVQGTTPLAALLAELRRVVRLPVVAAGGIADAATARSALAAGADAVACGTAFLAASEADVHPHYRERVLGATASDTELVELFDIGWPDAPHRVLRSPTLERWEAAGRPSGRGRPGAGDVVATRDGAEIMRYSDAQPTSATRGDVEAMAMYAGMSVGLVRKLAPAAEIVRVIARGLR